MRPADCCAREQEVLSAILARRWPLESDGALTMHVEQCAVCQEVATVAMALREDCDAAAPRIHLPAAGQVWWRAAVRARIDAAQSAATPITWIHGLAAASAAGLICAIIGVTWPTIRQAAAWAGARVSAFDPTTPEMAPLFAEVVVRSVPFAIAIGACLVLTPIALYFALSDD
jgi:hypothetical protein